MIQNGVCKCVQMPPGDPWSENIDWKADENRLTQQITAKSRLAF